ncbi:type II toxin-antitoxin system death-on-curing family toxin [Larkinella terrae]|uniref:Type II toxin-antitoxin system death-on-curing family toxin n=1 Tax=Larkinella terrae TaxID=2025311 RepID=A0A7K0EJ21_9BACT|nr:type II toxin-antitoxin system death-on-curing family toxin [Larkinella terrae]MRS61839.1 type II toxin-antitoxin system death-on-curing family toxin [Larkinella terrae]
MITVDEVLFIHRRLIEVFGGSDGVRDESIMLSAIARPYSGFGDTEFYPTPIEKAAAIIESIVKNHPFVDGNKRTGYVLMEIMLRTNNLFISASQEERYSFVIQIATGELNYDGIVSWIKKNTESQ